MTRTNPEMEAINKEQAIEMLQQSGRMRTTVSNNAVEVYEAYQQIFPAAKPIEIISLINSNRKGAVNTANAKANQPAPVYMAWFGWEPDLFNGRTRAFHCLDISFWFANTDLMLTHTGGGKRPRELADKMSGALLNFMRTGNPNGSALPNWPAYTIENGEIMILNDKSEVKNDPDRKARELL